MDLFGFKNTVGPPTDILLPGIVKTLFSIEENTSRFEVVCIDLLREELQISLAPTSKKWDRGRDGRSLTGSSEGKSAILCATLSQVLDTKIELDIKRLKATTVTASIYYCSSRDLSEDACDKLEQRIKELYGKEVEVHVFGQNQLVFLGERYPQVLRRHYRAEIEDVEKALIYEPSQSNDPEYLGLRLALITQTGDDASALRLELTRHLVLQSLEVNGPQSSEQSAAVISQQLHLSKSLSSDYMGIIYSQLMNDGLLTISEGKAEITDKGRRLITSVPEEATTKLLEGRAAVREAIKTLSGHSLTDSHYERVWKALQEAIAEVFHLHGARIVRMSGSLINQEMEYAASNGPQVWEKVGDSIIGLFSDPVQGSEVRQAVIDMFSEKNSEAFAWLTQVCSVYVMMCSLGFEAISNQEVVKSLRHLSLVVDSDVIISLLCRAEANHQEVTKLIKAWRALGGSLMISTPVLEEVAYHAWISEHAYSSTRELLPSLSAEDAKRLIGNAFVRTFLSEAEGRLSRKYWDHFIAQYRGSSEWDYSNVLEILKDEHFFDRLPEGETKCEEFFAKARTFFYGRVAAEHNSLVEEMDSRLMEKPKRDAQLLASVYCVRKQARQEGTRGSVIILSSSRLFKDVDEYLRADLGKPEAVISLAALACLLTLTPGIQMHLGTLRGVLFDTILAAKLSPVTRHAVQVIKASGQHHLPWSRRVTLEKELSNSLLSDARARGESLVQAKERMLRGTEPENSAKIIAKALSDMVVTTATEERLADAVQEIDHLREELRLQKLPKKK